MGKNHDFQKFKKFFKFPENRVSYSKNSIIEDIENLYNEENQVVNKGIFFILMEAINNRASDIHFENLNSFFKIRFRINGLLKEIMRIDKSLMPGIISKIKILSSLDIVEKRKPQDGRFTLMYKNREIDFRVSVIPTINGEKIVIRILDKFFNNFSIDDLYLTEENKKIFLNAINQNSGIILINGPTGSGKTTTLYSILNYKNSEEVNIVTVEDPIEYQIEGINQTQCNSGIGLDFSSVLRALLRQDPDILMIGEIRDKETAEIAVKASLTGHLVFSTLHSNNIFGCINRLKNLEISSYLLSLVLVMVVSQRLIRKLCPHCKEIDKDFEKKLNFLNYKVNDLQDTIFYTHSSSGCEKCMYTGYIDRIPVFEILYFDENNRYLLINNEDISKEIKLRTLLDDGFFKVKTGLSSLDELLRQL